MRSVGVGDYVQLAGKGLRFETLRVPGQVQRIQMLARHFGLVPRALREDALLCIGRCTLRRDGLLSEVGERTAERTSPSAQGGRSAACWGGGGFEAPAPRPGLWGGVAPTPFDGTGGARFAGERFAHTLHSASSFNTLSKLEEQEGYAGDKSSGASSADELESSVRSILPILAKVAMPTPQNFGFGELVARGGTPIAPQSADAADLGQDWL